MALRFTRRRALLALGALPLPILAACGAAPSPTAAPAKPTEAPKPAATTAPAAATAAPAAAPTTAPAAPTTAPSGTTSPTAAAMPAAAGGALTIASLAASLTKTMHPYPDSSSYSSSWQDNSTLIWSGALLDLDTNTLEYKTDMAKEYKVSADGKTFTFTLRDDLKWSDGSPITVDDFLFAYEQARNPENNWVGQKNLERSIASFTSPDAKTLVVVLKEAFARDITIDLANMIGPVPSKAWKGKSWTDPQANAEILMPTLVMGPYKVKEFKQAEQAVYEPVTTHFAGKPSLETITWKPVPQPQVAYELLKSGQVQWVPNITPAQYDEAKKNPDLTMVEWVPANASYRVIEFNMARPILADKKVREAIARTINRQDVLQVAEKNLGIPMFSFVTPTNSKWNNPSVEKYDFDLARARTLLQEAGYSLDAGTLKGKDGQPVKLSVFYPSSSAPRGLIATYVQQQLKQIGIQLEVRGMDFNAYLDQVVNRKDYDLSLGTYGGGSIDPDLGPKQQLITSGTQNITAFKSEAVDKLFEQGALEQDSAKRKGIYDEVQKLVTQELPVHYLYAMQSFSPHSKKLTGVKANKLSSLLSNRAFMAWSVAK